MIDPSQSKERFMTTIVTYAVVSGRDGTVHNVGLRVPTDENIHDFAQNMARLPGEKCYVWLDDIQPRWGQTARELFEEFGASDAVFARMKY